MDFSDFAFLDMPAPSPRERTPRSTEDEENVSGGTCFFFQLNHHPELAYFWSTQPSKRNYPRPTGTGASNATQTFPELGKLPNSASKLEFPTQPQLRRRLGPWPNALLLVAVVSHLTLLPDDTPVRHTTQCGLYPEIHFKRL
uniref:Uncharacterized protein n=1 Tax=Mycena chlorophos TaxID=658473 RepID=A0ABQ0LUE3_MYCCL|nr:predicted protein [Mycena chlorophos]